MVSLLKAEYKRLFSNVFFYVVLVLSVGVNLAVLIEELLVLKENFKLGEPDYYIYIDYYFCSNIIILLFVSMFFIPPFIGREFSDRVINNKVVSGAKRSNVFLAEFIVCSSALLIILAVADILVIVVSKIMTCGQPGSILDTPSLDLFVIKLGFAMALVANCALNVLLCMNIRSRVYSAIVVVMVYFVCTYASSAIYEAVLPEDTQIEIDREYFSLDDYGLYDTSDTAERKVSTSTQIHRAAMMEQRKINVKYEEAKGKELSGIKKYLLLFLNDVLPMNQYKNSINWSIAAEASPLFIRYMAYDIIITAILLAAGIYIFERRPLN